MTQCLHACYHASMKAVQYTIRNVPEQVDRYLRKKARLSGKSLNQVIIDELSERAGKPNQTLRESLAWFIGGNTMDDDTLKALAEDDKRQKEIAKREMGL